MVIFEPVKLTMKINHHKSGLRTVFYLHFRSIQIFKEISGLKTQCFHITVLMVSVNMNTKPRGEQKQIILYTNTDSVEELLYVDQVGKH